LKTASLESVLSSLESGARPKGGVSADSGEIPSIGGEHLTSEGGFDFTNIKRVPRTFFDGMRAGRIAPLDVLVVKDGATTGKTALVDSDFPFAEAAVNEHVFCARVDPTLASPRYVAHYLRSPWGQRAILLDFRGATVGGISREFAVKTTIPLAPLAEQRRIADVLDRANSLRIKRRVAIGQLSRVRDALFHESFDANHASTTIGDLVAAGSLLVHKDGNFGALYPRADDFGDVGVPFITAQAIDDAGDLVERNIKKLSRAKAERLTFGWIEAGDVLLAHNASVGKVAIYDGRFESALIGTSLTAFRPNRLAFLTDFLAAALRAPAFQRQLASNMSQTTRNQVPITAQRRLRLPSPSVEQQEQFVRVAAAITATIVAEQNSLTRFDALFASLQQRAFRGDL